MLGVLAALATGLSAAPPGAWRGELIMTGAVLCMAFYNVWSRPFIQRSSALGFLTVGMGTGAAARAVVPMISGVFFTGMALFMSLLGAPLAGIIVLAVFAVVVTVIGYRLGRRPDWQKTLRGSSGRRGGWVMGSSSSSRSSGGSRSGGFSGGRSGGGGASGRW